MADLEDNDYCFICGRENPIGLKLSFDLDLTHQAVRTVFRPGREHQGWTGRLHGGIVAAILDEVMVNAAYLSDIPAVTGEMTIRYRAALNTAQRLHFLGRITETRVKFMKAKAECRTDDGNLVAESSALLIRGPLKADGRVG